MWSCFQTGHAMQLEKSVCGNIYNIYDVATHAAIESGAEKLICLTQQASRLHPCKEPDLNFKVFSSNQPLETTKKKVAYFSMFLALC